MAVRAGGGSEFYNFLGSVICMSTLLWTEDFGYDFFCLVGAHHSGNSEEEKGQRKVDELGEGGGPEG